jgi:hypothetical protein
MQLAPELGALGRGSRAGICIWILKRSSRCLRNAFEQTGKQCPRQQDDQNREQQFEDGAKHWSEKTRWKRRTLPRVSLLPATDSSSFLRWEPKLSSVRFDPVRPAYLSKIARKARLVSVRDTFGIVRPSPPEA